MTPRPATRMSPGEYIALSINGTRYQVPTWFSQVSLADYLRVHLQLSGTKVMCREGGCGACTVLVAFPDPSRSSGQMIEKSINACLCPVLSCDGWEVTTVEGLGTQLKPHALQTALTEHYGTQCGYCTPGMLMRMHSLLQNSSDGSLTKQMIEDSFGGNICRCTGYRPILDAFRTFATDATGCKVDQDLEDLAATQLCKRSGKKCLGTKYFSSNSNNEYVRPLIQTVADAAPAWYKPNSLPDLYRLMRSLQGHNPYYVVGHTGACHYDDGPWDCYIDLKGIPELYAVQTGPRMMSIGANMPLSDVIDLFNGYSNRPGFAYLKPVAENMARTAHPSLRNVASWAGNLILKNRHKDFPSDTFISFMISDTRIITGPNPIEYAVGDFVQNVIMDGKIILRAEFAPFDDDYIFRAYKIMPRNSNSIALVNAGFRARVSKRNGQFVITEKPVIVFGNLTKQFIHAEQTELFLSGKDLRNIAVLQRAMSILGDEVNPLQVPGEPSPAYKKSLALSLFYKFALEVVGDSADSRFRSAVGYLQRPISSGTQSFPTRPELWPLTQPIPKQESLAQCTGEAKFISDIEQEGMLYAAFTLSTEGNATLYRVDSTDAMMLKGVVRVFTAADIPGINNLNSIGPGLPVEEFLAESQIKYAGQPVAVVVAVTKDLAEQGAKLVKIIYTNVRDSIVTCEDAIREQSFFDKAPDVVIGNAQAAIDSAPNKISGVINIGHQAHFHMETMVCVAFPTDDGLNIEAGTQWIDGIQVAIANCVKIGKNKINVTVKRNGGGFGAKCTRNNHFASATALAAFLLRRPVKIHASLEENLKMVGKRFSYQTNYQAGFDNNGKLLGIALDVYRNTGAFSNISEMPMQMLLLWAENAYKSPAWKISLNSCKTNIPGNTWCRGPASTESLYFMECIMEHISQVVKKPSVQVKMTNFLQNGDPLIDGSNLADFTLPTILQTLLDSSSYQTRLTGVDQFNQDNRWRKRGISVVPMRFPCHYGLFTYTCLVAVFHDGGTVAVTHGGIELGQGINTKVAQVVAHELGIALDLVAVQPTTSITSANSFQTANSTTSEVVCLAAIDCCAQLSARLAPIKAANPSAPWSQLVELCYLQHVDLSARAWAAPTSTGPSVYTTYGAMCTEVELDVLTGEYQINRCDLLYDCGESMSPLIDIGQVEGAVAMGFGYYTSEEVLYDSKTAELLTTSTWTYKPPTSKDIPVDLRIALLKNAPNPLGVLRSKIVAEPPLCMTCSVVFALRNAITASRKEQGQGDTWFPIDAPVTVERAQQYCSTDVAQLRYAKS